MAVNPKIIFIASFGSVMLEIVYWYELRRQLENDKYQKLLRSVTYWVIVIITVLGSGIVTWMWYGLEPAGQMSREPREYLLVGAATPLFFKKLISFGSKGEIELGKEKKRRTTPVWKDYFQIR